MQSLTPFVIGAEYVRKELLGFVGSSQGQSGVIWGNNEPNCLICTSGGRHGRKAGYADEQLSDGTWWYFGQGQTGDHQHKNAANRKLLSGDFTVLLFSGREPTALEVKRNQSYGKLYKFMGQYLVASFESIVPKLGSRGGDKLLRFRLVPNGLTSRCESSEQATLLELREEVAEYNTKTVPSSFTLVEYRRRSDKIHKYALSRAQDTCEACEMPAPFVTIEGSGFLEVHHIHRLADEGPDIPSNVIALCPNCHRKAHYSVDHMQFKELLIARVLQLESNLDAKSDIPHSRHS